MSVCKKVSERKGFATALAKVYRTASSLAEGAAPPSLSRRRSIRAAGFRNLAVAGEPGPPRE